MQYEDIVYKAGILAMAVRLEGFLVREWECQTGESFREKRRELSNESRAKFLIEEFLKSQNIPDRKAARELEGCMGALFKMRNEIAHPSDKVAREGDFRERDFKDAREKSQVMDSMLKQMELRAALPRMGEVMVSCSLRYDMGNAGDIVKHGVLAEFAEWWRDGELRFADPFGGRPWGAAKREVRERMCKLPDCALLRAQKTDNPKARDGIWREKYYGSSCVVLNAAGGLAKVFASDSDKLARNDLRAAGLRLIDDEVKGYDSQDGYSILDPESLDPKGAERFNLVLIDPYADFLRDELEILAHGRDEDRRFHKIREAIERKGNENLWIAVFVLMKPRQVNAYQQSREKYFGGRFVALRCPKFGKRKKTPAGESGYHMEILLVSSRLAEKSEPIEKLRRRIGAFKGAAEKALGASKIQAWGLS